MKISAIIRGCALGICLICNPAFIQAQQPKDSPRQVIPLDGEWRIAEGDMATAPGSFPAVITVPGLVDMAEPPFKAVGEDTGKKKPLREAFWYEKTFEISGPIPPIATLKIFKAKYGSQVVLNGEKFEERWPSFTPLYTDVRSALREGTNQLLIRVGASRDSLPPDVPSGYDVEKEKYIPGIYDSVELILTGTPTITNVQTAPEIESDTVRVQTLLKNDSGKSTQTRVGFAVREHKTGRIVGRGETTVDLPASDKETTATVEIKIENCRLWSPEDPFLYDIIVDCGTDRVTDRFGMRDFWLDTTTGRAYLNGEPYYMRGSNITLYRFFEDPERGALPWNEKWVRELHRLCKGMNWNSLRYCIGFPPEFWYDIADEEGILIQDEFPMWSREIDEPSTENLARQYADWMRERWNHPCVVIWDAQNESAQLEQSGEALSLVRHLDISGRPWDNGWGVAQAPGDSHEMHPYQFNKGVDFRLEDMETITGIEDSNPHENIYENPVIINEYGWIWLNRDGTPTTLTRHVYARLFDGDSTTEERRHLHARLLAALTEFWRCNRDAAAVLHFCILGYSRPGGATSDHFMDLANLTLEPEFVKYVKQAFSPVGIMLDFWKSRVDPAAKHDMPVVVINDLDEDWSGSVRLSLLRDGEVIVESEQKCDVQAFGWTGLRFPVQFPAEEGEYLLKASLLGYGDGPVSSLRDVTVGPPPIDRYTTAGLAHGKPVTASSGHDDKIFPPKNAVDGDLKTRWASEHEGNPQWFMVDLEKIADVSAVELIWERAYARAYHIEVSTDGESWTKVYKNNNGYGAEPVIEFEPTKARYVRLTCTRPDSPWGYSLWEMRVY